MKIAVIGEGLAALGVLNSLYKKEGKAKLINELDWIYPKWDNDSFFTPCSLHTTAVVALQGIKRGVSPLGDDLVDAFNKTHAFLAEEIREDYLELPRFHIFNSEEKYLQALERFAPNSDENSYQILSVDDVYEKSGLKLKTKNPIIFEKCWVFNPEKFLKRWKDDILRKSASYNHLRTKIGLVEDTYFDKIAGVHCLSIAGTTYRYDRIIDCRGINVSGSQKIKNTPGHYLTWNSGKLLSKKDMVLTVNGHNLINCPTWGEIKMGGTNEAQLAPSFSSLISQHKAFEEIICDGLPKISDGVLRTGQRPKGPKRRPSLENKDGYVSLSGFYKNGWTLTHLYGEKVIEQL